MAMLRSKLIIMLLVCLAGLAAVSIALTRGVSNKIGVDAEERLKSGNEVIRLANRVDDYSLVFESIDAAGTTGLASAMLCPTTDEELREANREQTPAIDAETGEPVVNQLGQPLDTDGRVIVERTSPTCSATQHDAVLQVLRRWNNAQASSRDANEGMWISERAMARAIPRTPDLLIVSDADGVVVARVGNEMDNWFGPTRINMNSFPIVARTELGDPAHGNIVWREYDSAAPALAQVGVAPITAVVDGEATFVGSVTVGYFMANEAADEDRDLNYEVEVAYFYREPGGPPAFAGTSYASDPAFLGALSNAEYTLQSASGGEGAAAQLQEVVSSGAGSIYSVDVNGESYLVVSTALARDDETQEPTAGYIVVTSLTDALAKLDPLYNLIPPVAIAFFVFGLVGILLAVKTFVAPIEEISKGVQEVIAGNNDYMWPVDEHGHLSDLSHSLNIMSARLQGKRDPDADDMEGAAEWAGMVGGGGGAPSPGAAPQRPAGIAGLGNLRGRRNRESGGQDGSGGTDQG